MLFSTVDTLGDVAISNPGEICLFRSGPKQLTMSVNTLVTVRYGPYESCGIVDHRTFRLDGIQGNQPQVTPVA